MGGGRQVVVLHVLARAKRKRTTDLLRGAVLFFYSSELLQGATQINVFIDKKTPYSLFSLWLDVAASREKRKE